MSSWVYGRIDPDRYTHMNTHTHMCTHMHTYTYMDRYTYPSTHIYIYRHMHIESEIHTYITLAHLYVDTYFIHTHNQGHMYIPDIPTQIDSIWRDTYIVYESHTVYIRIKIVSQCWLIPRSLWDVQTTCNHRNMF